MKTFKNLLTALCMLMTFQLFATTDVKASMANVENVDENPVVLPLTFETGSFKWEGYGGATVEVIENPQKSGINTSEKIAKHVKGEGETWASALITLDKPIDWNISKQLKIKVFTSRWVGISFKIESTDWISAERWVGTSKVNEWEELIIDFSDVDTSKDFNKISLCFDNGTMGDGSENWTFLIDDIAYQSAKDKDARLSEITINGTSINDFSSATTYYTHILPEGSIEAPIIGATANDANATVEITQPESTTDVAVIRVTSADGTVIQTYTIQFSVDPGTETGINVTSVGLNIYPNPVFDMLNITWQCHISHINIYNYQGEIIINKDVNAMSSQIQMSGLAKGTYFISIIAENGECISRKIIKE